MGSRKSVQMNYVRECAPQTLLIPVLPLTRRGSVCHSVCAGHLKCLRCLSAHVPPPRGHLLLTYVTKLADRVVLSCAWSCALLSTPYRSLLTPSDAERTRGNIRAGIKVSVDPPSCAHVRSAPARQLRMHCRRTSITLSLCERTQARERTSFRSTCAHPHGQSGNV